MRGFTMILVIYSHVCVFCFRDYFMAFNDVLFLLRMPCFFFISGWLFYQPARVWDRATVRQMVSDKFMVQIVPTFVFLALHERGRFFQQLGAFKGGYWFTFALFVYFVIYILTTFFFRKSRNREILMFLTALVISLAAFWYDVRYHDVAGQIGWGREVLGFMGVVTWRYYLFFYLGTLVKKHFETFLRVTDSHRVVAVVAFLFMAVALSPRNAMVAPAYLRFSLGGIGGMVLVFTFFRKCAPWFSKEHFLGRGLQYVGTRTLDVYLLHFFFLPECLLLYNRQLLACDSRLLEVTVVLGESLLVLMACLLTSRLLRLSPFLARYLFGVRDR